MKRSAARAKGDKMGEDGDCSVIALDKFILATRDSGYKGTASAISELVDNSLQAKASSISIAITSEGTEPNQKLEVTILDDGSGMDAFTLRQALRFGGSSRFNDRAGLGRYGMGLPNSSLSQARRVTVLSWQSEKDLYSTHLDVDEIASGKMTEVPIPQRAAFPGGKVPSKTGTLITWTHCDRLDNRRVQTICRKLASALGQTFRHFIWDGTKILINGEPVAAIDPLFLRRGKGEDTAEVFGEPVELEVRVGENSSDTGRVLLTFSLLPVHDWHELSNETKRELGISRGAGVSVVRAGREVDYGWFFLGNKRKESYDDWWRCEIRFSPELDEAFGITHTKQQIRPHQQLIDALTPDIEATAHALNMRARKAHTVVKAAERFAEAETVAASKEELLPPLPAKRRGADELTRTLQKRHPSLRDKKGKSAAEKSPYKIVVDEIQTTFFTQKVINRQLVLVLNESHPFYKRLYKPLSESELPRDRELRTQIELLLMAAARAEAALVGKANEELVAKFRAEWSDTLATFLNG